ncbi:Signal transduction histidine kinase [Clostridium collagenovorans DSM 3089]|uniref:histidine kinase n=1 Tax=Clostridium collagenovorans DSM 3089 TaxID=1121306 RepID=A0A1M5Y4M7_9CLOT|nr:HAMP domain-containing sensor histidine kinase [Clostridium collagenovorans]SHI07030.1 Signal transduction histidine kinase [Clostridium collagenovorans DSM 3089]
MIDFQNKDERLKIILYISIALAFQAIILSFIYYTSLKSVNNRTIEENSIIISKINSKDKDLLQDIIPVITGKINGSEQNIKDGREILNLYSYGNNLSYKYNPLIGNIANKYISIITLIVCITLIVLVVGIIYLIDPLFKEINLLTHRAENIVENKDIENQKTYKYKGSLDKFIVKFEMMEERIYNNIDILKEEKLNLKNIINDISHQLKTPLMALSMYNEILNDHREMEDEDVDNFITLSKEQLDRMDWLVKTLLKYARLESNIVDYNKEKFLLNNTIEESINPLLVKVEEKKQSLIFKADSEVYLYHDRKWIAEALSNIIKNAIEHTAIGGKIEVGVQETPITVRVWVKDNGEGIDESEIKKIFNRFHKGQNSLNPTSIGIGLCLSKSIVKSHNGDITVDSKVGEGSTFYITFIKIP